mmetsp:Transcript_27646/g.75358  ORF Transcript_27646/g.75358 Transcript_27646/m.75358 type:complete len:88 (+) Transcript_27646:690-953(+)
MSIMKAYLPPKRSFLSASIILSKTLRLQSSSMPPNYCYPHVIPNDIFTPESMTDHEGYNRWHLQNDYAYTWIRIGGQNKSDTDCVPT